jgi:preflagellin peptidase FlaK
LQLIFAAAQVTLTLVILVYASWSDYKTREVTNRVWVIYAPIALALSLAELLIYDPTRLSYFALSVGFTTGFALLLFYSGGFGGADSKALMCIALALPFFPTDAPLLAGVPFMKSFLAYAVSPLSQTLFPITILSNSVLVAAFSALYLLLRNLSTRLTTGASIFEGTLAKNSLGKKILVLLTGRKYPVGTLKAKWHIYPMEDIAEENSEGEVKRKLVVMPKDEGRDEIVGRLANAVDSGKISDGVWATPGLPMLIFVTIGLIIALSLGDVVWILVSHLFG